ncbi:MAG: hypothetical protein HQL98_10740 [Magnetococcales bacterium]|nr:hypothetical protein [Magnetococcales bacterium]
MGEKAIAYQSGVERWSTGVMWRGGEILMRYGSRLEDQSGYPSLDQLATKIFLNFSPCCTATRDGEFGLECSYWFTILVSPVFSPRKAASYGRLFLLEKFQYFQ